MPLSLVVVVAPDPGMGAEVEMAEDADVTEGKKNLESNCCLVSCCSSGCSSTAHVDGSVMRVRRSLSLMGGGSHTFSRSLNSLWGCFL